MSPADPEAGSLQSSAPPLASAGKSASAGARASRRSSSASPSSDSATGPAVSACATPACTPPGGSPFYRAFLSPLCDQICLRLVPPSVSPDAISFLALCCAALATFFCWQADRRSFTAAVKTEAETKALATDAAFGNSLTLSPVVTFLNFCGIDAQPDTPFWAVAGLLWMLYSVLDNVDGKQVRHLLECMQSTLGRQARTRSGLGLFPCRVQRLEGRFAALASLLRDAVGAQETKRLNMERTAKAVGPASASVHGRRRLFWITIDTV
ncbi:hypothetical protein TGRUB_276190A, partial [Toxoplasma gondii RUB]